MLQRTFGGVINILQMDLVPMRVKVMTFCALVGCSYKRWSSFAMGKLVVNWVIYLAHTCETRLLHDRKKILYQFILAVPIPPL